MSKPVLDPTIAPAIEQAIDAALRVCEPRLERAVKWRRPTYTVDGNWHHWLCAIETTKSGVHLMFHKGGLLDDPGGVLEVPGTSRYLRRLSYRDPAEVDPAVIAPLVASAVARQTAMFD